jgi:hypothetical protein
MALSQITHTDQKDKIHWRWTRDGVYTVASAYDCQFIGCLSKFPAKEIWRTRTEPKCRFFAWLVMHDQILTAQNMIKKRTGLVTTTALSASVCMKQLTIYSLSVII